MIGFIELRPGLRAVLQDAGAWECSNKDIEKILNSLFRPEGSRAMAGWGKGALRRAAAFYKTDAVTEPETGGPPEVVY